MRDRVDLGEQRVPGGYFLLRPDARPRPFADFAGGAAPNGEARHVWTYLGADSTIKEAALELIRTAREKIFIASFRIGEADLLDALYDAAARLRGGVYVISALNEKTLRAGLRETGEDASDEVRAQNKRFENLTRAGIAMRGRDDCHAKFLVIDDTMALISSANLETNALGAHESRTTGENGVVLSDPDEVARLARFFTRLWYEATYEMRPGRTYTVADRATTPSPCQPALPDPSRPGALWTHHDEQFIRLALHDIIGQARRDLVLSTFSLNRMVDQPELLLEPLERALATRHPRVRLLARGRNNVSSHRRDAAALARLGIEVYADSRNHAKGVIADRNHGALFSANFDATHGLTSGVETGVRLAAGEPLNAALRYFEHAMEQSDLTLAVDPTVRELDERLAARWRTDWPLSHTVPVRADDESWQRLRSTARAPGAALFSRDKDGPIQLYLGDGCWQLARVDHDYVIEPLPASGPFSADAMLESWLESAGRNDRRPRPRIGFCPALFERIGLPHPAADARREHDRA
jgi:phosphatidylserine/phosphatidylglycerophosphate/cardiolipin synthase-like enzyme